MKLLKLALGQSLVLFTLAAWGWDVAGQELAGGSAERRAPDYRDHTRLMVVRGEGGAEVAVTTRADWKVRRAHIISHFIEVAGALPGGERRVPLNVRVIETVEEPEFERKKIRFATEPGDAVPAWLLVPRRKLNQEQRMPAMLCLHQTVSMGKDEPVGLGGKPDLAYARELARRGYVTISPDYPNFGEYKVNAYGLGYASATMKAIWNNLRAVDLLESLAEVDPGRIGVIGHSLGGHNAIFTGLFDERLKAVVSSCGFNAFPYYYGGNIAGWSHKGYMPRLEERYGLDPRRVPFDFPELIGALAPRAFFANAPVKDANFDLEGVRVCIKSARPVFELLGVPERLEAAHPEAEHTFPGAVREQAYRFLDRELKRLP